MQYSFVFVLCLGALVMQCSGRPQSLPKLDVVSSSPVPPPTSSPAAESVMVDAESATEITNAGEQVVFDEGDPVVGASNDEADTPTTSMPGEESQQDEATTTLPCSGEECSSPVVMEDAASTDDAPAAPSEDDSTTVTTTQSSNRS